MNMASALLAQTVSSTKYELTRVAELGQWWHWVLMAGICIAVLAFVVVMYFRDTRDLSPGVAIALGGLRLFTLLGLLFTFLSLEKRTEREVVQNSRVILLLDASQSMGLEDSDASSSGSDRRIDLVVRELTNGTLLKDLRQRHDLVVLRFDESEQPVELASYTRGPQSKSNQPIQRNTVAADLELTLAWVRSVYIASLAIAATAIVLSLMYVFASNPNGVWPSVALLLGVVLLVSASLLAAVTNLQYPEISFAAALGREDVESLRQRILDRAVEDAPQAAPGSEPEIDWVDRLTPGGNETRLGEALISVINRQRGGPVAGIVLVSDGRNNAGLPHSDAVILAQETEIPIYTVGMGSNRRSANVGIVDMEAPARVYPSTLR